MTKNEEEKILEAPGPGPLVFLITFVTAICDGDVVVAIAIDVTFIVAVVFVVVYVGC